MYILQLGAGPCGPLMGQSHWKCVCGTYLLIPLLAVSEKDPSAKEPELLEAISLLEEV